MFTFSELLSFLAEGVSVDLFILGGLGCVFSLRVFLHMFFKYLL